MSALAGDLIAYWRRKAAGRAGPARRDIDPQELRAILPCLQIVEVEPDDFLFRLVGTHVVAMEGEYTGRRLSDLFPDRERDRIRWQHYWRTCEGIVSVRRSRMDWRERDHVEYEVVLLPLYGSDARVSHLLSISHAESFAGGRAQPSARNEDLPATRVGLNEMPEISLGEDGIVTVDYTARHLAATAQTVSFARQKILELGQGARTPVLVLIEAASGLGGALSETLLEPEHAKAVAATAVISRSPAGQVASDYYARTHNPEIPVRPFDDEAEARDWLRTFTGGD